MHRIDTPTAQKDKFGQGKNGFTRGNPQTGTLATKIDYLYCDAVQEEIANVIESAGFSLNKEKHDQLNHAIQQYVKTVNDKIDDIKKIYQYDVAETRFYSPNKKMHFVFRNDGIIGVYSRELSENGSFLWYINHDGIINGKIAASNVMGLNDMIPAAIKLSSETNSTSETDAATSLAVKTVNDKLDRSLTQFVSKTGDTIQNCLMVSADHPSLQLQNTTGQNMAHLLSDEGNFALIYKNRAGTWENKLLFDCVKNEWRFDNVGRVKINHSNIVSMSDYQTNNGFRKSPDGYIHQWGEIVIAPTRDQVNFTVVFPVAFNERCDFFQAVYRNDACFITEIQRTQTFFRGCLFERLVGDGIIGGNLVWMAWGK
ncbi:hypothetical protein A9G11_03420 [Gilliamella sp. wkB108]|uniref:phage tail protein n=1 Tax=Gilliamella sp. wkB108 TaxID=3120256 RepID=UPI00080EDEC2|nr:phage tail protein [Gilliamella apicola]OCG24716.1 hypothetical protein A9G11_03420 [Gilliamella apicola]